MLLLVGVAFAVRFWVADEIVGKLLIMISLIDVIA